MDSWRERARRVIFEAGAQSLLVVRPLRLLRVFRVVKMAHWLREAQLPPRRRPRGDIAPRTALGQVLASGLMIMGDSVIAVPTGIVSAEITGGRRRRPPERACRSCGAATTTTPPPTASTAVPSSPPPPRRAPRKEPPPCA